MDFIGNIIDQFVSVNLFTGAVGLIAGFGLLWVSANLVTQKIAPIARFFRVKELVITILGISILSSLPEFFVSVFANLQGKPDTSLGNVIGSNFVTLTFVTAVCGMIAPMTVHNSIKEREAAWMTLSSATILFLAIDGRLSRIDGIILVALYLPYMISVIREAMKDTKSGETIQYDKKKEGLVWVHFIVIVLAIIGILAGAELAVRGGSAVGRIAGIPEAIIGLVILAFGTSLPEFSISLSALLKKKADVTIGEIYASNIFTAMFVLGVCVIISPMETKDPSIMQFGLPLLILAGIIIQIFITTGSKLVRVEAFLIFLIYAYFILRLFFNFSLPF